MQASTEGQRASISFAGWRPFVLVLGGWSTVGVLYLVQQALATGLSGPMVFRRLLGPYTAAVLTPAVVYLARRFPLGTGRTGRNLAIHAAAGASISVGALSIIYLLDVAVGALEPIPLSRWLASTFHEGLTNYVVIVGAAHLLDARRLSSAHAARAHQAESLREEWAARLRARFRAALRRARKRQARALAARPSPAGHLMLKLADRAIFVSPAEVRWIQADGHYVLVHTTGGQTHMVRETLRGMEGRLGPAGFVRIHRSTLVNLEQVRELRPWFAGDSLVLLRDGTELRMSRRYGERLHRVLGSA
ncbi:LytTR family DNA-binding domain-containing protein [Longimicrobium sp.]|jgi:two-component system LytT family response regulator|uniref:LytTR family DNA-binding domain-containing protein n=1 Tax=Longimicrobium sp. TaxID=2029185 RepID=UPI002ED924B2